MNNNLFRLAICSAMVFCCLACAAAKRPIVAHNDHLQEMAPDAVQRDIDECIRQATEAGPGSARGKQIAGQTAGGAVVGAASGAVAGAISGGPGLGAAAGAAG
jgi:outer membrane lipoprotein SlyB